MPCSFPAIFPRELRDQIYDYVLSSPTGCVELCNVLMHRPLQHKIRYRIFAPRDDGSQEIRLSFLRCKIIHKECRNKFWDTNTMDLDSIIRSGGGVHGEIPHSVHRTLTMNIQHVILNIDFMDRSSRFRENWGRLGVWAADGKLASITLIISSIRGPKEVRDSLNRSPVIQLETLLDSWKECQSKTPRQQERSPAQYRQLRTLFQSANAQLYNLKKQIVRKKLIIEIGTPLQEALLSEASFIAETSIDTCPDAMLRDLSAEWGFDVEVNGTHYCTRGKQQGPSMFTELFRHDPVKSCFMLKRDVETLEIAACLAAKHMVTCNEEKDMYHWVDLIQSQSDKRDVILREVQPWVEDERRRLGLK